MKKTKGLEIKNNQKQKKYSAYHFIEMKLSKFQFFIRKKNAKMFRCKFIFYQYHLIQPGVKIFKIEKKKV